MAPDKTSAKRDIVFIEHRKIKFRLSRFLAAFLFAAFILAPCVAAGAPADAVMTEAFAQSAEQVPVTSVDIVPDLTGKQLYLDGSSHTFEAVVTPSSADQRVTWSLRDAGESDNLVTKGYVTSADVTAGSITIKTTSNANESGSVKLIATTVGTDAQRQELDTSIDLVFTKSEPTATGITLNAETLDIDMNSIGELTATVSPDSAEYTAVTWTISPDIAQISYNDDKRTQAVIKPLMAGEATVTASVYDHSDTCSLTVTPAAEGITISPSSAVLKIGESLTLTATVTPPDAADIDVTWESSDETVATVDADGLVSAKSAGTAVITASCVDRGLTSTATITVVADDPAPQPSSGGGGCSIGHGVLALLAVVPFALRKKK